LGNIDHKNEKVGKGRHDSMARQAPEVRGSAMTPRDHAAWRR
jgi:ribosomal protein L2